MNPDSGPPEVLSFTPTRWTLIMRARGDSAQAQQALGELCEAYWMPVFRFLRSEGRSEDAARELTQEFFARLLARRKLEGADPARGRFRSYLLGAVKHFLADVRERQGRLKRGGGIEPQPLDAPGETGASPALQLADPSALPPDSAFDRAWGLAIMDRALSALQQELAKDGKAAQYEILKPWLEGDASGPSQAAAAAQLGMNESAVKVAVHRLRKRFRELVRADLAQTVASAADIDDELRYLVEVLSQG